MGDDLLVGRVGAEHGEIWNAEAGRADLNAELGEDSEI
jgi:hypothetical protein